MKLVVKFVAVGLVLVASANLGGCFMLYLCMVAITPDTEFKGTWGGYESEQKYRLKEDVFLCEHGTSDRWFVAPGELVPSYPGNENPPPPTVAVYRADPAQWPIYAHVIPAGTHIQVRLYQRNVMAHTYYSLYADILDGDIRPKKVGLLGLSRQVKQTWKEEEWEPNPLLLERVMP